MRKLDLNRIMVFLFCLSVFLLGITKISDPDAWLHLSLGKLIWEMKALPTKEALTYPNLGAPFGYSSWLFGLTYYLTWLGLGTFGVIFLKTATITSGFYILLKDSLRPYKNQIISIMVMTLIVIVTQHRFVERPDTFLLLFLAFSIFSLNAFLYDNKKYIYALPFTHLIWANMHTSINLMTVPFLSFLVGGLLQQYFAAKGFTSSPAPSKTKLKIVFIIFMASFAASLASPYSTGQFTAGVQFLSADWAREEIIELAPPVWPKQMAPFLMTAALVLSFIANRKRLSIIHVFMVIPFIYLSFTAVRFIFLLGAISGPIIARNLSEYFENKEKWRLLLQQKVCTVLTAVWIVLYASLSLAGIKPFSADETRFGFGFDNRDMPEGALTYMDKRQITGKIFNREFHWGQYITWRDFPRRTAFIDGRVSLSGDTLEMMTAAQDVPSALNALHEKYGFESALFAYHNKDKPSVLTDRPITSENPGWALVYWDDVSFLYLKRGQKYDPVIELDEYRFVKPVNGNIVDGIKPHLHDEEFIHNLSNELRRNLLETGSSEARASLGFVYTEMNHYREAIDVLAKVISGPYKAEQFNACNWTAYSYLKLGELDSALDWYKKSTKFRVDDASTYFNIGLIYLRKKDAKTAARYLEKASRLDTSLLNVYPPLLDAYKSLGIKKEAQSARDRFEQAKINNRAQDYFLAGQSAYTGGRYENALSEFKKALYLDKSHAFAHYGMALVYQKQGMKEAERDHLKEFLKIKPTGDLSRKAKAKLREIDQAPLP